MNKRERDLTKALDHLLLSKSQWEKELIRLALAYAKAIEDPGDDEDIGEKEAMDLLGHAGLGGDIE